MRRHVCPSPSIRVAEIERFVVDRIRGIGHDLDLIRETVVQARRQTGAQLATRESERAGLATERVRWLAEVRGVATHVDRK